MLLTSVRFTRPYDWDRETLALLTLEFDNSYVVKDVKLIQIKDKKFLAFPEKMKDFTCPVCKKRNPLIAKYCMMCSNQLRDDKIILDKKDFVAISHPATLKFRQYLYEVILPQYETWAEAQ